jgi:small subunit ribosomal protein S16
VAVKIRLKRMGKIRAPFYRVVVMDSRTKRDGRAIEEIGKYHPTEEPSLIDINSERAQYWLAQGAQPTEAVEALFKVTGDWQKFKGEAGAEGTLKVAAAKPSKKELYEAAVAAAGKSSTPPRLRPPRARAAKKAEAPAAGRQPTPTPREARGQCRRGRRRHHDGVRCRPTPTRPRARRDRPRRGPGAPGHGHRRSQGRGDGPLKDLRHGSLLEVRVHPDDLGRVIGRSGRTASALRTVMTALAGGQTVRIDIVDTDRLR